MRQAQTRLKVPWTFRVRAPHEGGLPDLLPARPPLAAGVVGALAALKLVLHLATLLLTPYGVHRDELLYLAMGERLRLWEMDFPPLVAVVSMLERGLLGDSLLSIRLLPALAGTALVVLAALLARELGGGRFAQALAALAVVADPVFLRSASLLQPVVFDQLWWTLGLYALVRLSRSASPHWWVVLGVAAGLGLATKLTVLFFGAAVLLALLSTPWRRALLTPWPWVALLAALTIGSPTLVGQYRLDLPAVGQLADLQEAQLSRVTPLAFIAGQLFHGPALLLALLGAATLLGGRLRAFRLVGWACLWAFVLLLVLQGKPYYVAPVYPVLFGAGSAWLEGLRLGGVGAALRVGAVLSIGGMGVVALPFGLPILPPAVMEAYTARLGMGAANRTNIGAVERLPQDYADMLGWPEQAAAVARVYRALPPGERARAVVFAGNYGQAGAIDFHGRRHGLPRAVSSAGSYWFFGPGERRGEVMVSIGVPEEVLRPHFRSVRTVARVGHPYAVAEERDVPIVVSRGPYRTLQELWPALAGMN